MLHRRPDPNNHLSWSVIPAVTGGNPAGFVGIAGYSIGLVFRKNAVMADDQARSGTNDQ
jgi:hypothetical protein